MTGAPAARPWRKRGGSRCEAGGHLGGRGGGGQRYVPPAAPRAATSTCMACKQTHSHTPWTHACHARTPPTPPPYPGPGTGWHTRPPHTHYTGKGCPPPTTQAKVSTHAPTHTTQARPADRSLPPQSKGWHYTCPPPLLPYPGKGWHSAVQGRPADAGGSQTAGPPAPPLPLQRFLPPR